MRTVICLSMKGMTYPLYPLLHFLRLFHGGMYFQLENYSGESLSRDDHMHCIRLDARPNIS